MPQLINWELIKSPVNWIIVALMLAIAAFGLNLIMTGGNAGVSLMTGSTGDSTID
jgi:hypothetical protein